MNNNEIAALFEELADIMEIAGEDYFKIRAYRNAAVTIRQMPQRLEKMAPQEIIDIPGIGKAISEKIQTSLNVGTFPTLERWRQSGYFSFRPLMSIPGLNMRKLRTLIKTFNLSSIDDLKKLIDNNGPTQSNVLDDKTRSSITTYLERKRR